MDEILKGVLPQAESSTARTVKISWSGLDRKHRFGSGALGDCENVSTYYAPYLSVAEKPKAVDGFSVEGFPLTVHAYDNFVVAPSLKYSFYTENTTYNGSGELIAPSVYRFAVTYDIKLYRPEDGKVYSVKLLSGKDNTLTDFALTYNPGTPALPHKITSDEVKELYKKCEAWIEDNIDDLDLSVTGFQFYTSSGGKLPVTDSPSKRMIFSIAVQKSKGVSNETERKIFSASLKEGAYAASELTATDGIPPIRYLATHQGRVWGAKNTVVAASAYADYSNWETDLSYMTTETDGYGAAHAWISSLQADNYSSGDVTGIFNYLGNLIVFRNDYMFEISGTKNPFRVNDIINIGTVDGRSAASCGGILFFAAHDGIYAYSGSVPERISDGLDIRAIKKAAAVSDGRHYRLYAEVVRNDGISENKIYVYDTEEGAWSICSLPSSDDVTICGLTMVEGGVYAVTKVRKTLTVTYGNDKAVTEVEYLGGKLYRLDSSVYTGQNWFAETEIFASDTSGSLTANPKRVKEVRLIAEMAPGSELNIFVSRADDNAREGEPAKSYKNEKDAPLRFPIVLKIFGRSCYGYKIALSGVGFSKIYGMEVIYADGGAYTKTDKDGITKA